MFRAHPSRVAGLTEAGFLVWKENSHSLKGTQSCYGHRVGRERWRLDTSKPEDLVSGRWASVPVHKLGSQLSIDL